MKILSSDTNDLSVDESISINMEMTQQSRKTLGLFSSILFLVSIVIGTGIFISVNTVVQSVPSIFFNLLLWLFGGLVAIGGSLCYTELALLFPSCGGEYAYYTEAYNDMVGFSFIMSNFLFTRPISVAAVVLYCIEVIFETYYDVVPFWYCRICCLVIVWFLFLLHSVSNTVSIKINDILAYFKFMALVIVIGIAGYKLFKGQTENIQDLGFNVTISPLLLGNGFYSVMWSYDGYNVLVYMIEEMKDTNQIKIASVVGLVFVIIFYLLINFSYFLIVGVDGMLNFKGIVKSVAQPYLKQCAFILMLLVSLSAFGSSNGAAYSNARIYVDPARRGHVPKILSAVHRTRFTPIPSLFLQVSNFILFPLLIIVPTFITIGFINDWFEALISVIVVILSIPFYYIFIYNGGVLNKIRIYKVISYWIGRKVDKFYDFLLDKLKLEYSQKPLS